jgi:hypothetical protein
MAGKRETLTLKDVPRARGRGVSQGVGWRLVNPRATLFWKVNVVSVHSYGGERFAVVRIRRT